MEKKQTAFKKVHVIVTSNGYTVYFEDYKGNPSSKDYFVAKTLDEVKKILQENLIPFKDY